MSCAEKRERVIIRELEEGQEHATNLKSLLLINKKPTGSLLLTALAHLDKVHTSFAHTLSLLHLQNGSHETRIQRPAAVKDRRGSYKRRKSEETWTNVSQNQDNHGWRKYGQKEILNSKFPRSYFRCTRKYEQGCKATKQVQQTQENPVMYQITYIGLHTCKDTTLMAPQMLTFSDPNNLVNSSKVPPIIKQEDPNEETQINDLTTDSIWSEWEDFELSKPPIVSSHHFCTDCHSVGDHQSHDHLL